MDPRCLKYIHAAFAAFDIYLLKRHNSPADYIKDDSFTPDEIKDAEQYWEKYLKDDPQRCDTLVKMITAGLPGAQEGFTIE